MRLLGTRLFRHHPKLYGGLSRRGVPDAMLDEWFAPATASAEIRRDLTKFATSAPDRATLLRWSEALRGFTGPALVVWATDDTMMPAEHGPRLVATLPDARLVLIDNSATLIPIDQPDRLAEALLTFLRETDAAAPPR